jgi:segregation and condensation protein A
MVAMYRIHLPNFEGPFDLLLYFIKRDEINIYDIPIAKITEEFLSYIRLMQMLDLELAGEFIVMASTLIYIKTQMLLPRYINEETGDIEDPRTQLVERLLEYKQFKEASKELTMMAERQRYIYYRNIFDADYKLSGNGINFKASLFDLLRAFKLVLERNEKNSFIHEINSFTITVEEKITQILDMLKSVKRFRFFKFIDGKSRQELIVTFLALLELIKLRRVFVRQSNLFEDISIQIRN